MSTGRAIAIDDVLLRRVEVRGEYAPRFTVFVDNQIHQHRPGFHVATPLRISGSQRYVLVNRGWVASPQDRSMPQIRTPAGEQVVQGVAVGYSERYLELSTKVAEGNIWQNLVFERYRSGDRSGLCSRSFCARRVLQRMVWCVPGTGLTSAEIPIWLMRSSGTP